MANMRPPSKSTLLKVVILGDGGVGKSCLMNRFVSNRFDENSFHTIGVEFMNKDIEVDGQKYTLQVSDFRWLHWGGKCFVLADCPSSGRLEASGVVQSSTLSRLSSIVSNRWTIAASLLPVAWARKLRSHNRSSCGHTKSIGGNESQVRRKAVDLLRTLVADGGANIQYFALIIVTSNGELSPAAPTLSHGSQGSSNYLNNGKKLA